MIILDNLVYLSSAIALLILAAFGLFKIFMIVKHKDFLERKNMVVFRLNEGELGMRVEEFIKKLKTPFAFEAVVQSLGKKVEYYLVVPKWRSKRLLGMAGVQSAHDYHIFSSGGSHQGVYLKGGDHWPEIDIDKLDFSKVNEVGEGVVVQFIFKRKTSKKAYVNVRLLASAPSSFQVKEIISSLKASLKDYSAVEVGSQEFMHKVNLREFDSKEQMVWRSA